MDLDEIRVIITGDASGLSSTISQVEGELNRLNATQTTANAITGKGTKSYKEYKQQMEAAKTTLAESKAAYDAISKSGTKQIATLEKQQGAIKNMILSKQDEIKALEKANAGINKGSVAYRDNLRAIEWTKNELNQLQGDYDKVTRGIDDQNKAIRDSKTAYERAKKSVEGFEQGLSKVKAESWQKAGKGLKEFGSSIDDIAKPLYLTSAAFAAGSVAAAKFAIDFEDNFAAVKKTVDGTPEQLDAIKQSIIDMTTVGINGHNAIPLTTAQLTELAAAGGQLGIQTENIAGFTETMAMLGTATNLVGEQGAATLARFMNVTNTSQDQVSNLGSAIVDLGNNFATTEAEIAQMALNMGATGSVVGISAQDVLAYSTALSSLGVEAMAGGSAVSRIWMDIQKAVSGGGEDLEAFAKISKKSSKEFADQWKNDASGAFQDFLKGLGESKDQIGTLADLGFNNIRDIQALQRLAGPKGFELLTDAIKRSNEAWSNNVALQNEFDAKAETTASQIQVTKNNLVEAARGFGEMFLPTIKNVTGGIAGFAKGLASLDNGTKQNIIGIGAAFIGLGAAVKGTTGIIKGIGGFVSAIGDIKAAFSAGGALASLGSIASVAGPAALAIGGLTAAILVGKAAYDNWYDSQYRWSKGLSEGNERVKESLNKYKNLSSIQKEVNDLQWVIKNPESSAADVENAKSRLEEIKSLLSEEYNLVINSDNSNLDETLEKVKQISANELQSKINSQNVRLGELQNKNQNYEADRKEAEKNYNQALDFQTKASDAKLRIEDINRQVKDGTLDQAQAYKQAKEIYKEAMGDEYRAINEGTDNLTGLLYSTNGISQAFVDASNKVKYYSDEIKNLDGSHAEMVAVGTELANWQTELVGLNAAAHDNAGVMNNLHSMGDTIRKAGLDMSGYAQAAALAMNGLTDFNGAVEKFANGDGADLSAIIRDYSTAMDAFGATAEQKQAGLQSFAQQLTDIAHNAGLFEGKQIEITADGKIDWKDIEPPEEEVTAPGKVEWSDTEPPKEETTADGTVEWGDTKPPEPAPIETLGTINWTETEPPQEAHEEVTTDGTVEWQDTEPPEPAPIEALGQINWAKSEPPEQEEFTAEGTVNYTGNYDNAGEAPQKEGVASYTGDYSGVGEAPAKSGTARYTGDFSGIGEAPTLHGTIVYTAQYQHEATGTQNFGGGLAMVNDQKGVSDPRELIVDKGRAFIPEGRDVILPLSKGAKVYTAAETRRILAGAGIPHYASGKNNHYGYDITDEMLQREYRHIFNKLAMTIRTERGYPKQMAEEAALASMQSAGLDFDGSSVGISSSSGKSGSSSGGKKENSDAFKSAKEEWDHYTKTHALTTEEELEKWLEFQETYKDNEKDIWDIEEQVFSLRQKQYSEQTKASEQWLAHETKYNGLAFSEQLDAIDRIRKNTVAAYEAGLISHKEYLDTIAKYDEEYLDTRKEQIAEMFDISKSYISERTYFNDWTDNGDDPLEAYNRVKQDRLNELNAKELTQKEYDEYMKSLGSDMYSERREQSENWLEEQRKYFNMSAEDYAKGIDRMKKYTQEYYDNGLISRREYNEAMTELRHMELDEAASAYEEMLSNQSKYISDMRDKFSKQEQELRDSWTVADRKDDMATVRKQLNLYRGAVTEKGQQKYKELQEQMKQLQRDEELYNLQVKNTAVIDKLEAEYSRLEEDKAEVLAGIARNTDIDVSGIVGTLTSNLDGMAGSITTLLQTLINTVANKEINVPESTVYGPTYQDNRTITLTEMADILPFMGAFR